MRKTFTVLGVAIAICAGVLWLQFAPRAAAPASAVTLDLTTLETVDSNPSLETGHESKSPRATAAQNNNQDAAESILRQFDCLSDLNDIADSRRLSDLRQQLVGQLVEWVRSDPAGASRFVETHGIASMREELLRQVSQLSAAQDSTTAENWAEQMADVTERNTALTDVCIQVAQANAPQAILIAERHSLDDAAAQVLENVVQQWAHQDFANAAAWVLQRPEGEQREQMISRLAVVEAQTNPAEAARLIAGQMSPGRAQEEAAMSVVNAWIQKDPGSAAAWVQCFPAGPIRDRAERELANASKAAADAGGSNASLGN